MSPEITKKYSPPYISHRSFYHLIEHLQEGMPDRIDRSYLNTMFSGSNSTQILAAMRFLKLADNLDRPTHHLRLLVDATGEERNKRLKDLCFNCYGVIFNNGTINLQTATFLQLEELFAYHFGVNGDVRRKCIKFFTTIATDAGITLSQHITNKVRTSHLNSGSRTSTKKPNIKNSKSIEIPQVIKVPENNHIIERLLAKFPEFNVAGSPEERARWLEGFNSIVQIFYPELKK